MSPLSDWAYVRWWRQSYHKDEVVRAFAPIFYRIEMGRRHRGDRLPWVRREKMSHTKVSASYAE